MHRISCILASSRDSSFPADQEHSMFLKTLNHIANKYLAPSKSVDHGNVIEFTPVSTTRPIWMHGFARSGTTSSMYRVARALGRNAIFEPFHPHHTDEEMISSHLDVIQLTRSVPRPEQMDELIIDGGMLSAFETFGESLDDLHQWQRFVDYLDAIYNRFGCNSVVKEIRLFANLTALDLYHRDRSIDWLFIGLLASPTVSLNSYYRRGWLSGGALRRNRAEMDQSHSYRVETFRRLGRFEDLTEIPVDSPAEKMLLNCLMDQAELQRFVAEDPENRRLTNLAELPDALDWIGEKTGETHSLERTSRQAVSRIGHGVDRYFYRDVIERLSPRIREALEENWGPVRVDSMVSRDRFRRYMRSLRHRAFLD